jgi:hypothetical protein
MTLDGLNFKTLAPKKNSNSGRNPNIAYKDGSFKGKSAFYSTQE